MYCTVDGVKSIVVTDMEDHDIQNLINETDAIIDLTVSGVSSTVLRAISKTWTAYKVMLKDPASESMGGHSENRSENLRLLKGDYERMLSAAEGGITFVVGGINA